MTQILMTLYFPYLVLYCRSEQSLHSLMINQNYIIVKGGTVSGVQGGRLKDRWRLL